MLFINDDQPKALGRGEHGAAGADDDLGVSGRDAPPVSAVLGVAQMAVQHGHLAAAAAKTLDRLRRQADFRHHHQRFLALPHHLLDGAR